MSSSTQGSSLFCLGDVYQIKYCKAKYLQISAKQSKGQTNRRCGNSLRQVCRQGQEHRRWNTAHLETWRWWKYWLWTWIFPSIFEREYWEGCNKMDKICFMLELVTAYLFPAGLEEFCCFHNKICSNFFFLLSFFSCIDFYNIPLTVFFLFQLYRQCWVSWTHSLSVT